MLGVRRFVLDRVGDPVLEWELLQRRRRRGKAYVAITRIVYGLYFTALILFLDPLSGGGYSVGFSYAEIRMSKTSFFRILQLLVCVVFLVVPVFAGSSVVGERRGRTLELVQLSLLRPFDIVWAKVVASITPSLVFVFGFMPVALFGFFRMNAIYRFMRDEEYWFLSALADATVFLAAAAVLGMVIVLTVSALSVLISTFANSSVAAITVSYGMAFMFFVYLLFLIPDSYTSDYYHSWSTKTTVVYYVVVVAVLSCAAGLFVWWACKRLRLPVVSTSAKSSVAGIPVSLFVVLMLLLLLTIPVVLETISLKQYIPPHIEHRYVLPAPHIDMFF